MEKKESFAASISTPSAPDVSLCLGKPALFSLSVISLEVLKGVFPVATTWLSKQIFDELSRRSGRIAVYVSLLGVLVLQVLLNLATYGSYQLGMYLNNDLNRRLVLRTEEDSYKQLCVSKARAILRIRNTMNYSGWHSTVCKTARISLFTA